MGWTFVAEYSLLGGQAGSARKISALYRSMNAAREVDELSCHSDNAGTT